MEVDVLDYAKISNATFSKNQIVRLKKGVILQKSFVT